MNYKISVQPATEPVSLAEARNHLRLDAEGSPPTHPDDDLVEALIAAAREYAETHLNRAIMPQTVVAYARDFADRMTLPFGGATEIATVQYIDTDGVTQTLSADVYGLDNAANPAFVYLKPEQSWPAVLSQPQAVRVTYQAGYAGSPPDVPSRIKQAILLMVADMYENREAQIIGVSVSPNETVDRLLYPLRELSL